ncbi:leucyl/phenylalanyl-tRNA--protein transferase [Govanella unica]|uniref:Leucyl/phenylalanyl-tRNA--protein transferase n=1 Tax=Govanella unica TaxID=2975056 RepID=A0A9X3Z6V8_9PROT|nr:leucyl/phenylalanyl-tRNA--protein transferase [Govania unica]
MTEITADLLLHAYARGYFPMAETAQSPELYWIDPEQRGILPLDQFHIPKRLVRTVLSDCYRVTHDRAFRAVMEACAASAKGRENTWINAAILEIYCNLHDMGYAHSIEVWDGDRLVGGLYGVALGAAFFGESMFHSERDASKVALVHLVARLKCGGFRLLDTQFVTEHLKQFGTREISRADYKKLLETALQSKGIFSALPESVSSSGVSGVSAGVSGDATAAGGARSCVAGAIALQAITQTS